MFRLVRVPDFWRCGFTHKTMRTKHSSVLVKVRAICRNHSAFDSAKVMRIVEGKIRCQAESSYFASLKHSAVRFSTVLDQGYSEPLEFIQQFHCKSVISEHMSQEYSPGPRRDLFDDLLVVHSERTWINIDKNR